MIPFQALYVYAHSQLALDSIQTPLSIIKDWIFNRQKMEWDAQTKPQYVHNKMKQFADRNRLDKIFKVGDFVYLKLQPYM